jgi:hypothetical protein
MERVIVNRAELVQQAIEDYADGDWLDARGYAICDRSRQIYAVVVVPDYPRQHLAGIVVLVRLVSDQIVIEHDSTDRPLWNVFVEAGIPREQVICTYAGEKLAAT